MCVCSGGGAAAVEAKEEETEEEEEAEIGGGMDMFGGGEAAGGGDYKICLIDEKEIPESSAYRIVIHVVRLLVSYSVMVSRARNCWSDDVMDCKGGWVTRETFRLVSKYLPPIAGCQDPTSCSPQHSIGGLSVRYWE